MKFKILKDGQLIDATILGWAKWFETADRAVATTERGGYRVSTVCLGFDHAFPYGGEPEYFETMIFKDGKGGYQTRCGTLEQAFEMHKKACEWLELTLLAT